MDTLMALLYTCFALLTILAITLIFVIPYAKLVFNRWKLRFLEKKGWLTIYLAHKNGTITEHIIQADEEKFELKDATYVLNPKKVFLMFSHRCYYFEENNPEPKDFIIDERSLRILEKDDNGQIREYSIDMLPRDLLRKDNGQLVAAGVIDAKTFTNLLNRAYAAGQAWANKNKNLVLIFIGVVGLLVMIAAYMNYQHTSQAIQYSQAIFSQLNRTSTVIQ